jgi:hypothetical protein
MKHSFLILTLLSLLTDPAFAQGANRWGGPGLDFRKKAEAKEGKRWTLQEWLEQKERNRMMDLWLAMYAPSPYEYFLSGSYQSYENTASTQPATSEVQSSYRSSSGSVGAYAYLMGLQVEYENNIEESFNDLSGSLNLRVLGNAVQGTHLILNYGQRTRNATGQETLRQQFAGADLDLYLMRSFGLHGHYRGYLPTSDSFGDITGSRSEAGAFIDFGALRVFGNWFSEKLEMSKSGIIERTGRTGVQSGLKFFF